MTSSPTAGSTERHRLPVRTLVAASIGNAVEWYDWTIYATFSIYFATQIFPPDNAALALISTLATYALVFFFRPLGGLLLGRFADLRGRRTAMLVTILLMAGGSVVIGLLPTYEMVGWLAPVLLLLARIAQGMSLGGEVSNASAYLAEIAPADRRGRYSSFFYISTGTAVLIASLMGFGLSAALTEDQLASWGWRIPFIIGGVLGLIGMWMRRQMAETEQFEQNKETAARIRNPLMLTLREHPRAVAQLVGFTVLNTLCYYTFFSALTPFATKSRGADATEVFLALSIATAIFVLLQYPMGAAADRYGRRPQLLIWSAATAILVVPLSFLIGPGFWNMLVVFVVGLGLYTMMTSIAPAIMSELFPTSVRGLGIGAWYNLTVAVFGGTAPLVVQSLQAAGLAILFFVYVAVGAVIAFVAVLTLPETKGSVLR
ncbi:major facilitator transporter [Pseudonocardia sp. EC080610-09]|nr:major facilitator transporter [Pseudonocardia sp. EC080625-04]ALL76456.1 major facilitator transporter [Pseudonocardia sp. EC080610-09]ALL83483.1 major facilitator transporter [Pseudonocardia sp. EC080619-01]